MNYFRLALLLMGAFILLILIAGHLNTLHPAFDSLSHFRLHLAAVGILTGSILMGLRSLLGGSALVIVSALSLMSTVWPLVGSRNAQAADSSGAIYRLLQANLRFDNQSPENFIRLLGETAPDVATIQEIPDMWIQRLKTVSAMYPHQLICPGNDKIGGVAIISRRSFIPDGLSYCERDGAVAVQSINFGGRAVTVAAMHLEWPWPKMQPQQLVWLSPVFQQIRTAGYPILIGGDMNAAPWSAAVQLIARETGTRVLPQVWGTWIFKWFPKSLAPWIGLPIDNILNGEGIELRVVKTQRQIGSDHRPILVEFSLGENENDVPATPDAQTS